VFAPRSAATHSTRGVVAPEIELTGTGLRLRGSF
jgi:hypothetical protein